MIWGPGGGSSVHSYMKKKKGCLNWKTERAEGRMVRVQRGIWSVYGVGWGRPEGEEQGQQPEHSWLQAPLPLSIRKGKGRCSALQITTDFNTLMPGKIRVGPETKLLSSPGPLKTVQGGGLWVRPLSTHTFIQHSCWRPGTPSCRRKSKSPSP